MYGNTIRSYKMKQLRSYKLLCKVQRDMKSELSFSSLHSLPFRLRRPVPTFPNSPRPFRSLHHRWKIFTFCKDHHWTVVLNENNQIRSEYIRNPVMLSWIFFLVRMHEGSLFSKYPLREKEEQEGGVKRKEGDKEIERRVNRSVEKR